MRLRILPHLIIPLLIGQTASGNRECREVFRSRFLEDSRLKWIDIDEIGRKPPNLFDSKTRAIVYSQMTHLPAGLHRDEAAFFQGIFDLLRSRERVFDLLWETQSELMSQGLSFEQLLREYESREGIQIVTVPKPLTPDAWMGLLAQGYTVVDEASSQLGLSLGPGAPAKEGHWIHGKLTHRLQLHLVLRDYKKHPNNYGHPSSFLSLYRQLGNIELAQSLDWSKTGIRVQPGVEYNHATNLFFQLFDSPENNASSPGFYYEYREYWPDLPIF